MPTLRLGERRQRGLAVGARFAHALREGLGLGLDLPARTVGGGDSTLGGGSRRPHGLLLQLQPLGRQLGHGAALGERTREAHGA